MVKQVLGVSQGITALDEDGKLADLLTQVNELLVQQLHNGQEVFMVLDDPNVEKQARRTPTTPQFGHVFDDTAEMYSGGVSDGKIWQ